VSTVSQNIDRVDVVFDEANLVANAGLVTVATLAVRLGLERLVDETVRLVGRVGGANPGSKILTLVHTLVAGGTHIDHADLLRAGDTERVLPFRVAAPSTLGTFLRSFTFGHVRQLDAVIAETLKRVWNLGAGPGDGRLIVDLDSTICEVFGYQKQGAVYGYTKQKGYHPLLASRADTGEILHARLRKGSSQRGHVQFLSEVVARVRRAGATGEILVRADSGFWSRKLIDSLERLCVKFSITVNINPSIRARIAEIPDSSWVRIAYPDGGRAEVASFAYTTGRGPDGQKPKTVRMVVRRTRLLGEQAALWPDWRYHIFVTNRHEPVALVDREHRHHAVVELAIRDLKEGAGLSHVPSGHFSANGAWLACTVIAHNLIRWTSLLGDDLKNPDTLTVARTFRTRLIAIPGRLINRAGRITSVSPPTGPGPSGFSASSPDSEPSPNSPDPPAATTQPRRHLNRGVSLPESTHPTPPPHRSAAKHRPAPTIQATQVQPVHHKPATTRLRRQSVDPGLGPVTRVGRSHQRLPSSLPVGSLPPTSTRLPGGCRDQPRRKREDS
jgi:hypothetical protein